MTNREKQIEDMIGSSIDPTKLRKFEAAAIVHMAQARSRRRRKMIGVITLVAAAAASAALLVAEPFERTTEAQPRPAGPPARPGCPPPGVSVQGTTTGPGVALRRVSPGQLAVADAALEAAPEARITRAVLIIARPGSSGGAGEPAELPVDAALRPENQLASGSPLLDVVPAGQKLSVSFRPEAPGRYPVFAVQRYVTSETCQPPAPPAGTPVESSSEMVQEIGEIVVQ